MGRLYKYYSVMKILDFIIISYYIILRKAKQNQLEASLFAATISPILFSLISILFWVFGCLVDFKIPAYLFVVIIFLSGLTINRILLKHYLQKKESLDKICDNYLKFKVLFIFCILGYFIFSIAIFFYSVRYLPLVIEPI